MRERGDEMYCGEIVVFDDEHDCAYLPGRTARLPHRFPLSQLSPGEFDSRLADGDRLEIVVAVGGG